VIEHSCPVIVLDDVREELWQISHGLSVCGLPIMPHLIVGGRLERQPPNRHEGVRLLFTDLHVLGPTQSKPELYVSALVRFIQQLINPSTYLIVFWSAYPEEAERAWELLVSRLKTIGAENLIPFGYRILDKAEIKNISDEDIEISAKATEDVNASIKAIFDDFPQLKSLMQWESCASRAASATSNELISKLDKGGIPFTNCDAVKSTLKRMSQEALGLPHAPNAPTKGVYQALSPIAQDWLSHEAEKGALDEFLDLNSKTSTPLPAVIAGKPKLATLLNDFFIHTEQSNVKPFERGALIRVSETFLNGEYFGLVHEIGLTENGNDWREAICVEFGFQFTQKSEADKNPCKSLISAKNIYVVELSADCDYAQDKARSHRFLLALFVPNPDLKNFYSKSKNLYANEAIYSTPEITLDGVEGKLLISCRVFISRPNKKTIPGNPVTRIRQEVLSEIAHHYATHMRRPGKIAFF